MGSVTTTVTIPPMLTNSQLSESDQLYLQTIQRSTQLNVCDTTNGDIVIALPPAGLNSSTGQSAQNQELTYIKIDATANTVEIDGAETGTVILTTQGQSVKFKSDATSWYAVAS